MSNRPRDSGGPSLHDSSCQVCDTRDGIRRCSGCKAVEYCGQEHQKDDWSSHRRNCSSIKKARQRVAVEEAALRKPREPREPDAFTFENVFENHVGQFWGILETRSYMRYRFALSSALLDVDTRIGAAESLEHLRDMLRLCTGDNMGLREVAPGIMLRLGGEEDQKCYEFIKWWTLHIDDMRKEVNTTGANALEPVDLFIGRAYPNCYHLVALVLLKIKLLLDAKRVGALATAIGSRVPTEVVNLMQDNTISPAISRHRDVLLRLKNDPTPLIKELANQIKALYERVGKVNAYMWDAFIDPGENLGILPNYYGRGTPEEMQMALKYTYKAWIETAGSIDVLRELRSGSL